MLRKGIQSLKSKMRLLILQKMTMKKRKRIVMKIIHQKRKNQVSLYKEKFLCLPDLISFMETTFVEGKNSVVIPFLSND